MGADRPFAALTAPVLRRAQPGDVTQLVHLMARFYAESNYPLIRERAESAFSDLIDDERLGRVWLIETGGDTAGYVALTLGFSLEYGGRDAFVDDLFVLEEYRNRGLGAAALAEVEQTCRELGVRALHLEAERGNDIAQRLYRRAGFEANDRQLLTLRLAAPVHEEE